MECFRQAWVWGTLSDLRLFGPDKRAECSGANMCEDMVADMGDGSGTSISRTYKVRVLYVICGKEE